jgi:hypothetical protein
MSHLHPGLSQEIHQQYLKFLDGILKNLRDAVHEILGASVNAHIGTLVPVTEQLEAVVKTVSMLEMIFSHGLRGMFLLLVWFI